MFEDKIVHHSVFLSLNVIIEGNHCKMNRERVGLEIL
jgi:hypothetical protein